jgi:hypothetical protein
MNSVFIIPRANTLRFVDITNYPQGLDGMTFDNKLLMDEKWSDIETTQEYLQKFVSTDQIMIQFTTNHDPDFLLIHLCYQDGRTNDNVQISQRVLYTYQDNSGNKVYNYTLIIPEETQGFQFIKIISNDPKFNQQIFYSEAFEFGDYGYLPYIQWKGSDRDGIFWDQNTIFGFRAELKREYSPSGESSVYEGFNFQPQILFDVSKRGIVLKSNPLPRYIVEKLKIAFDHNSIFVNGIEFNSNGTQPKVTAIEYSNLYTFEHTLLEVAYEDYSVLQEISGVIVGENNYFKDYDNTIFEDYDNSKFIGQP